MSDIELTEEQRQEAEQRMPSLELIKDQLEVLAQAAQSKLDAYAACDLSGLAALYARDRIAALEQDKAELQSLVNFYKQWIIDAGMPIPDNPQPVTATQGDGE